MRKKPLLVPVSRRALFQRINRALAKKGGRLRAYCGGRPEPSLGEFYIVDTDRDLPIEGNCDLKELGKRLGVLKPYERLDDAEART